MDPAGGSANSRLAVYRTVQSSFGSSAGSASSEQRSPQSSFEGQDVVIGGRGSASGAGAVGPLIAMYHPGGAQPPRPPLAQTALPAPELRQAPAISMQPLPHGQPAAAAAAVAARAQIPQPEADAASGVAPAVRGNGQVSEDWRPGVRVAAGEYPGSPILPTDNSRCDAIMKCASFLAAMPESICFTSSSALATG